MNEGGQEASWRKKKLKTIPEVQARDSDSLN